MAGDVNDAGFLAALVNESTVEEFGQIDVVVNNAGGSASKPFLDTRVAAAREVDAVQRLRAVRAQPAGDPVPAAQRRRGHPQHRFGGRRALAARGQFVHSLTKAAEAQLTKLMAAELAPRIRVNAIQPGAIETDALRTWLDRFGDDIREQMVAGTAMRRNGQPEDIAHAALYLCSPAASFVTGKMLTVDGGASATLMPHGLP